MESLFQSMPLRIILSGNLLLCIFGVMFTLGAPVLPSRQRLKPYIIGFWSLLTVYYLIRLIGEFLQLQLGVALNPWFVLVVLADLSPMILCLGCAKYMHPPLKHAGSIICPPFALAWLFALLLGHNTISQILTSCAFFFVAWQSRLININISLVLISYGVLSLPFGLVWNSPATFGQSVFLLLLVTKLPLLGGLYQVLTTVSTSQEAI